MIIDLNGASYHLRRAGNGFPLLLLHGFTGDGSTWEPFVSQFGSHSALLMPDLLGHGLTESPIDSSRYKMERAAADLCALMDKLGIEQADVLGYSMGGRLALGFAMLYPERVRKLVLESTTAGLQEEEEKIQRRMKDAELAEKILNDGIESFIKHWESIPLFRTQRSLPGERQEELRRQRLRQKPVGLANSLLGMGTGSQPSWWEMLSQLDCATLVLTGEKDDKFTKIGEKMGKLIPDALIVPFLGAGHALHVEQPEKFGTIVSGFLNERGGD